MLTASIRSLHYFYLLWKCVSVTSHPHNLAWSGGPIHSECEHSAELLRSGQHVQNNIIAIKAVTYNNEIYVITPRYVLYIYIYTLN